MTALVLDTVASIQSTTVASTVQSVIANGFAVAGDGGASLYARSVTAGAWEVPAGHSMFVTYSGTPTMLFYVQP